MYQKFEDLSTLQVSHVCAREEDAYYLQHVVQLVFDRQSGQSFKTHNPYNLGARSLSLVRASEDGWSIGLLAGDAHLTRHSSELER